jgi:ABC-type bacteriocin/lantibiotic exporter with double-glycine peptidase domain
MKLKIPLIKQKRKKTCALAAMAMVYKYFGKNISEEDILEKLGDLNRAGSFPTDHALMAQNLGFKVVCHSYALIYFDPNDAKLERKDLIKKTESLFKKEKRAYNRQELKSILRVLKSAIDFKMKMPRLDVIRKFLDKKLPVAVAVNSAVLFEKKLGLKFGHFIVLTGYEKDKFYYNDPYDGKAKSILADKLIFALSNNIFDSSAYLLVLSK